MRKFAWLLRCSTILIMLSFFTLNVHAMSPKPASNPPEAPYHRLIDASPTYSTDRFEQNLFVYYTGSESMNDEMDLSEMEGTAYSLVKVASDSYLKTIYMEHLYQKDRIASPTTMYLVDEIGNIYGPFSSEVRDIQAYSNTIDGQAAEEKEGIEYRAVSQVLEASEKILLKKGTYRLYTSDPTTLIRNDRTGIYGAFALVGVDQKAQDKFETKWLEWSFEEQGLDKKDIEEVIEGSEGLFDYLYNNKAYKEQISGDKPVTPKMPVIALEEEMMIEEIVFNTFNNGNGATPGNIGIYDEAMNLIADLQAIGVELEGVANGLWMTTPKIVLPKGNYVLVPSNSDVLTYDGEGTPEYMVSVLPKEMVDHNFTGRYVINADLIKTSNILGPVTDKKSSFTIRNMLIDVIDHGDVIEIIGEYEDMPFAQICEVINRTQNSSSSVMSFSMTLPGIRPATTIGGDIAIELVKNGYNAALLEITGSATYLRAMDKEGDMDKNTYDVIGDGHFISKFLSPMVTKALTAAGMNSIGNIPGPDIPFEGLVGVLFPPLIGVIGQVISGIIKEKELEEILAKNKGVMPTDDEDLSVGEQAMKDANNSMKDYAGDEETARAMGIMAEALANTDEPDDDMLSIGDNEINAGASDSASRDYESSNVDYDESDYETPEEPTYEEAELEIEPPTGEEDPYAGLSEEDIKIMEDWEEYVKDNPYEGLKDEDYKRMTIPAGPDGRTMDVVLDPLTGGWFNPESGNDIDLEIYRKDVLPNIEKDQAFLDEVRIKAMKPDPYFSEYMEKAKQDAQIFATMKKYHIYDEVKLREKIGRNMDFNEGVAKRQLDNAKFADNCLYTAEAVQIAADAGVDLLAEMTGPVGKTVKLGYTGIKGFAGQTTDAYVKGNSLGTSAAKGFLKGSTDYVKALMTGEIVGKGPTDYALKWAINTNMNMANNLGQDLIDGKNNLDGMWKGVVDGTIETTFGAGGDLLGGPGKEFGKSAYRSAFSKRLVVGTIRNGRKTIVSSVKGMATNAASSYANDSKKWTTGAKVIDEVFLGKG